MSENNLLKNLFLDLFQYNDHFNKALLKEFVEHSNKVSERSIQIFNHIINAHQIWNNRIDPQDIPFNVWEIHTWDECNHINENNYRHTISILENNNLENFINYKNSKGEKYTNSIMEILFHIINHSTYHRGQIAMEFKKCNLNPVVTDYIFYKR
ncbi:MAG: hypothetical protein KatS3mg129_2460 [Leptospiraceae bacterium]|nr:MAG: hypothetical protein KatS3mg129_2460 [Leptospiraceae bacterium]